jgi:hypothetical protein
MVAARIVAFAQSFAPLAFGPRLGSSALMIFFGDSRSCPRYISPTVATAASWPDVTLARSLLPLFTPGIHSRQNLLSVHLEHYFFVDRVDLLGQLRSRLELVSIPREQAATVSSDKRERTDSLELRLKDEFRMIERL